MKVRREYENRKEVKKYRRWVKVKKRRLKLNKGRSTEEGEEMKKQRKEGNDCLNKIRTKIKMFWEVQICHLNLIWFNTSNEFGNTHIKSVRMLRLHTWSDKNCTAYVMPM